MTADKIDKTANDLEPAAIRTLAVGAQAICALAVGALAIGALALGAVAIGRLAIGRSKIKRMEIDELVVKKIEDSRYRFVGNSYSEVASDPFAKIQPVTRRRFRALVFASESLPPEPESCPQARSCTEWLG
jgi:hypothetical protein